MNSLQIFDFHEREFRTTLIDGKPWFVGSDRAIRSQKTNLNPLKKRIFTLTGLNHYNARTNLSNSR